MKNGKLQVAAKPSYEQLKQQLADAQAKLAPATLEFRVGEKGGVSVYGLGRFPVTLYYEQWLRVLERAEDLKTFLEAQRKQGRLKLRDAA